MSNAQQDERSELDFDGGWRWRRCLNQSWAAYNEALRQGDAGRARQAFRLAARFAAEGRRIDGALSKMKPKPAHMSAEVLCERIDNRVVDIALLKARRKVLGEKIAAGVDDAAIARRELVLVNRDFANVRRHLIELRRELARRRLRPL